MFSVGFWALFWGLLFFLLYLVLWLIQALKVYMREWGFDFLCINYCGSGLARVLNNCV